MPRESRIVEGGLGLTVNTADRTIRSFAIQAIDKPEANLEGVALRC